MYIYLYEARSLNSVVPPGCTTYYLRPSPARDRKRWHSYDHLLGR